MQRWYDFIADYNGKPLAGATVRLLNYPALTTATYFTTTATTDPQTIAMTSGEDGSIAFYAADGRYQLSITGRNGRVTTIPDILVEDPADGSVAFATIASTATYAISAGTSSYAGTSGYSGTAGFVSGAVAIASTATWALGAAAASTATTALTASTATTALAASTATWALGSPSMISVSVTQTGGTLTVAGVAHSLTLRSTSLIDGSVTNISADPADLILPPQATLGLTNGVQGRLVIAEMNNNGTSEFAISNQAGGLQLNEENLISPTAISTVSTSANSWYATTTRTTLAYKIVAAVDIINTASSWSSPALVQAAGGQATFKSGSTVRLQTANGYGTTNTKIRRFTTVVENFGTDITYADSAANGASFTINKNGVYAISYTEQFSGGSAFGVSRNSAELTTALSAITAANRLVGDLTTAANFSANCGGAFWLNAGDIIRPHTDGGTTGTSTWANSFTITRVG